MPTPGTLGMIISSSGAGDPTLIPRTCSGVAWTGSAACQTVTGCPWRSTPRSTTLTPSTTCWGTRPSGGTPWTISWGGLRCGKELGSEYVLISVGHGGDRPPQKRKDRLLSSLRRLTAEAEALEQKIILETLTPFESNTCTRLEELLEVLDTISSPMLLGMCDVVVPFVQGEDPADYPLRLGDRMAHLHLVDSDGGSETHLLPGEGRMDLRTLLYRFREAGYDGRATLELVTHYISDPSGAARTALEQAKELLL